MRANTSINLSHSETRPLTPRADPAVLVISFVEEAKRAYGDGHADQDLLDHLDPASSFNVDVGGEA
jgi:hypothetical protein